MKIMNMLFALIPISLTLPSLAYGDIVCTTSGGGASYIVAVDLAAATAIIRPQQTSGNELPPVGEYSSVVETQSEISIAFGTLANAASKPFHLVFVENQLGGTQEYSITLSATLDNGMELSNLSCYQ